MMGEAFGVPGDLAAGAVEEPARLVEVADGEGRGRAGEERGERVVAGGRKGAEFLLERGGLDEEQVGGRVR